MGVRVTCPVLPRTIRGYPLDTATSGSSNPGAEPPVGCNFPVL